MRVLAAPGCPYPMLFYRLAALSPEALERIEQAMLPPLRAHLGASFLDIVRVIGRVASEQGMIDLDTASRLAREDRVLEDMQLLMHRLCALGELLKKVAWAALPAPGRKNKAAQGVEDRIEYRLERNVKLPINMIKHQAFRMEWVKVSRAGQSTQGYCVRGPVGRRDDGPLKHRPKDKGSPEAYSFAYVLRDCMLMPFDLATALEQALDHAQLLGPPDAPGSASEGLAEVAGALEALNSLPRYGFFDEGSFQAPRFELHDGGVQVTMRNVRTFKTDAKVSFSIHGVSAGVNYRMPYFKGR